MRPTATGTMGPTGALALMLTLMASGALAQSTLELSLADAVTLAIEREPSLREVRAEVEVARGRRRQAGLRPNPLVTLDRREEPAGSDNQTMVELSLPLDLFRRRARVTSADREFDVADRSLADRTRLIVNGVKMRYAAAAAAARELDVAANLAATMRRELELVTRRVDEGASPPLDRDRLTVETRRLESGREMAAGRADAALFALKRATGLAADASLKLQQPLGELATVVPPTDGNQVGNRPDVVEAEARVSLADAHVQEARAYGRLDMSVYGSYMRMDAGFPQRGFSTVGGIERVRGVFHYISGGVMVTVPLWNRNQGGIAAAEAQHEAAAARLDAARLTAQAEVAAASGTVARMRQAAILMADAVRLARQNLDIVRQTYELGRGTLSDVLIEQRRYLETEQEYTSALREAFEARVALEFARGELR